MANDTKLHWNLDDVLPADQFDPLYEKTEKNMYKKEH